MPHLFQMRQSGCVYSVDKLPFPLIRELFSHRSFMFYANNPYVDIPSWLITNISFIARTIIFGTFFFCLFKCEYSLRPNPFSSIRCLFKAYCIFHVFILMTHNLLSLLPVAYIWLIVGQPINDPSKYIMFALIYDQK